MSSMLKLSDTMLRLIGRGRLMELVYKGELTRQVNELTGAGVFFLEVEDVKSNRTDWKNVVREVMEAYEVPQSLLIKYWPEGAPVGLTFVERLETELHNAFVAGQESEASRSEK